MPEQIMLSASLLVKPAVGFELTVIGIVVVKSTEQLSVISVTTTFKVKPEAIDVVGIEIVPPVPP